MSNQLATNGNHIINERNYINILKMKTGNNTHSGIAACSRMIPGNLSMGINPR